MSDMNLDLNKCAAEGPETALERQLVAEFLHDKGYKLEDLHKLPAEQAKKLMAEACKYASLRLADIEAKTIFRKEIHPPV